MSIGGHHDWDGGHGCWRAECKPSSGVVARDQGRDGEDNIGGLQASCSRVSSIGHSERCRDGNVEGGIVNRVVNVVEFHDNILRESQERQDRRDVLGDAPLDTGKRGLRSGCSKNFGLTMMEGMTGDI